MEVYSKPIEVLEVREGAYEEINGAAILLTSYLMRILGIHLHKNIILITHNFIKNAYNSV